MGCDDLAEAERLCKDLQMVRGIHKALVNSDNSNDIFIELFAHCDEEKIVIDEVLPAGWKHWPWNTENRYYWTSIILKE